jgi:phage regulator Rha-like protein
MPTPSADLLTIRTIRETKVILDSDLARLYGVPTFRLNEAVKRNVDRFPADFCFQLTRDEFAHLISQFAISSGTHGGRRKLPWAFTEHGALMAANVLNSSRAVQMSIFIVRAFLRMREELATNAVILKRLAQIDRKLLVHDVVLRDIYRKLQPLLAPPPAPAKREIGFHVKP